MKQHEYEPSKDELLRAFPETPQIFKTRMDATLRCLSAAERRGKRKLTLAPVLVLVLIALLASVAVAALYPRTAERFGEMYGEDFGERLMQGDTAELGVRRTLGSVTYTVTDVIYADGVLYGTVVMEPAEGENVVLMPEDADVRDPAGYNIHSGETVPEGAKSYAELAAERGARIVLARCVPEGYVLGGELMSGDIGYSDTVTQDGSIVSSFELYGWNGGIARADSYTLQLYLSNWEVTPEGEWLREEPQSTWLRETWDVAVAPQLRERTPEPAPQASKGVNATVPEGYDGTLPVLSLTQRDYRDTVKPEDFTFATVLSTQVYEECVEYRLEGDMLLTVGRGMIGLCRYDVTEELTLSLADGTESKVTSPRNAVTERLFGLAVGLYHEGDDGHAYAGELDAPPLPLLTLEDARRELDALLERLHIDGAKPVAALAVDARTARSLNEARNQKVEAGVYPGMNPYDLSGMTERDEGYLLVYRGTANGVPTDAYCMSIYAYVTVDGVRSLMLNAPFVTGQPEGDAQTLIAPEEALAYAVRAAQKSWLPELAQSIEDAECVELIYAAREKARLVPAWQVNAFEESGGERWPLTVIVSALDGAVLSAPWM